MKMPSNIMARAAVAFVCMLAAIVAFTAYATFFEKPWLEYRNLPFPPLSLTRPLDTGEILKVSPGEVVPLEVARCNLSHSNQTYLTTHAVMNVETKTPYILDDALVSLDPGCRKGVSLLNKLPQNIPPGKYIVFGTAQVRGIAKMIYVDWFSGPFNVEKQP